MATKNVRTMSTRKHVSTPRLIKNKTFSFVDMNATSTGVTTAV